MPETEPDWDTVMEQRAEMERDARACPECHGNGWTEGPGCNCGAGPNGYYCDLDSGPVLTTEEFCPAHGDSDKFPPEPEPVYGEPPYGCSCPCHGDTHSPICDTCCDER